MRDHVVTDKNEKGLLSTAGVFMVPTSKPTGSLTTFPVLSCSPSTCIHLINLPPGLELV